MIHQCPSCRRYVDTSVVRNANGRGTHRRFDLHYRRNAYDTRLSECDMSEEPVADMSDPQAGA